jgi:DNA-binding LytR/AlgR family response regulator
MVLRGNRTALISVPRLMHARSTRPHAAALVADDDEASRAQLIDALQRLWPELHVVAEVQNGADAWDAFLEHSPQVCFLDVRMPGFTGIDVARRIAGRAHVVFVAASGDHALAAFEAGSVSYVQKPIDDERLAPVLARLQQRLQETPPDLHDLLGKLIGQVRKPAPLDVVQASLGRESKLIPVEDVVYFEADARYTRAVHLGGEDLIRQPLKDLLAELDSELFMQIHRSVIVNQRHIAGVSRLSDSDMVVNLRGRNERLPVSRHFQPLLSGR